MERLINGCWQLSTGHREVAYERAEMLRSLQHLVEVGLATFDCADIYLGVEDLLGELARSLANGSEIRIHTKYVPDRSALAALTRRDVERGIERSLRRLGVERLDLVQFHWWDYETPGWLEAAGWLSDLRSVGKIRLLGVTNFDTRRLSELIAGGIPIVSNQVQYSLLDRRVEGAMVEFCRSAGIQLLTYGALAGGFLSGRWVGQPEPKGPLPNRSLTKYRLIIEEFGGWQLFQELLAALSTVARRHRASLSSVALRWVLDRTGVAAAIVGTRGVAHLTDHLRTFELRLDDDDRRTLDHVLERATGPLGEPYGLERVIGGPHERIMKTELNRDS